MHVPFDSQYHNVLEPYEHKAEQIEYFQGLADKKYHFENIQPVRDNVVRLLVNHDATIGLNYVIFQNKNFNSRWFYAFIVGRKYVNAEITEFQMQIDVWQTFRWDFSIKPSYIVRQHSASDELSQDNLIPEQNFELGQYYTINEQTLNKKDGTDLTGNNFTPVVFCSDYPSGLGSDYVIKGNNFVGNYYSGLYAIWSTSVNSQHYENLLDKFVEEQKVDSIVNITNLTNTQINYLKIKDNDIGDDRIPPTVCVYKPPNKNKLFGGYIPKNNKLYQYPYCFFELSTNDGQSQVFNPQDFLTNPLQYNLLQFVAFSDACVDPSMFIAPVEYRVDDDYSIEIAGEKHIVNLDYKVTLTNFPTSSYTTDSYKAWLAQQGGLSYLQSTYNRSQNLLRANQNISTAQNNLAQQQNQVNAITGLASNVLGGLSSIYSGNVAGVGQNALNLVETGYNYYNRTKQNELAQENIDVNANAQYAQNQADYNAMMTVAERQGDVAHVGKSSTLFSYGMFGFTISTKSIRKEFAEQIDSYFTMYGYPVHRIDDVSLHNRKYFDYVQLDNANITTNYGVNDGDLITIKSILQNGVTIWHDSDHFLDYTVKNEIV